MFSGSGRRFFVLDEFLTFEYVLNFVVQVVVEQINKKGTLRVLKSHCKSLALFSKSAD